MGQAVASNKSEHEWGGVPVGVELGDAQRSHAVAQLSVISLLLWLSVVALYLPVRQFSFVNFDDNEYVTENPYVLAGLKAENIRWAFTQSHSGHWHPLTWISHMLDVELLGMNPGAHHLVNVGFHALNTVLMLFLTFRLTGLLGLSVFCAALFGFHPMRLESVAWVAERKDVLSVCFGLLTSLAYLRYAADRTVARYLAVLGLFAIGLLAKPMLVTLPVLFLLFDLLGVSRAKSSIQLVRTEAVEIRSLTDHLVGRIVEKVPLLCLSIGSSVAVIFAQKASGGYKTLADTSLVDRLSNVFVGYLGYLGKLFWPSGGGVFYPLISYPPGVGVGAFLSVVCITFLVVSKRQRYPYLCFGWLWFLISLLPVIGFVQVGGQSLADRWTYLPHIGLIIALSLYVRERALQVQLPYLLPVIAAVPLLGCFWVTQDRLPHWRDSEAIFRYTLAVSPDNFMAHTNLGAELDRQGRLGEATVHYEEAARLHPGYPQALNNLGILRARQNRVEEAVQLLQRTLAIQPGHKVARYNLGIAYSQRGDNIRGAVELIRALAIDPGYGDARSSLQIVAGRLAGVDCWQLAEWYGGGLKLAATELKNTLSTWSRSSADTALASQLESVLACE